MYRNGKAAAPKVETKSVLPAAITVTLLIPRATEWSTIQRTRGHSSDRMPSRESSFFITGR